MSEITEELIEKALLRYQDYTSRQLKRTRWHGERHMQDACAERDAWFTARRLYLTNLRKQVRK